MDYKLIDFDIKGDERGSLVAFEENHNVPFDIKRVYYIFGTDKNMVRGKHAHKVLNQLLICTSGSCTILLDDGDKKKEFYLNNPRKGLYIEGLLWREMYNFTSDCVLMVLASDYYDEKDYIRDYCIFKNLTGAINE
jgi:dTDP-4-dehydrorhamnose 3,5-epimerase-like enzyme